MFTRCWETFPLLRNALDTVREIGKLIKFSPKRSHLFNQKLIEAYSDPVVTVKSLCLTRWTAITSAIEAVLKDYSILMDTMAKINTTTHDVYGLKAGGILTALDKFNTLFGLKLGHILFAAAEQVSKTLQGKDTTLQEALSAVNLASAFYWRQRTDEAFNRFYDRVTENAQQLAVGEPELQKTSSKNRRWKQPPSFFLSM